MACEEPEPNERVLRESLEDFRAGRWKSVDDLIREIEAAPLEHGEDCDCEKCDERRGDVWPRTGARDE